MGISCIFPMYNEAQNAENVVSSAQAVFSKLGIDFEIILVNDGSTDNTGAIIKNLAQNDSRIRIVNHSVNLGYGRALRSGFAACRYDMIFQCDGDQQYNLEEIDRLLPYIDDHDFVVGYRLKRKDPFYRKLEAGWYRFLLWIMFGLNLKDANCAFKIYKKPILEQLNLTARGALINGEIFLKARELEYDKIKEVGVHHFSRPAGVQTGANPGVLFDALIFILLLWFQWIGAKCCGKKLQ